MPRIDRRYLSILFFLGTFLVATTAHYLLRPKIAPTLNRDINAGSAAWLINTLTPDAQVRVDGFHVGNGAHSVLVQSGCDGLDALLMLLAAVIAFPMGWRRKVVGLVAGTLMIYGLNVSRIAALWYTLKHRPAFFDTMHYTVGQTVMIAAAVIFFVVLTGAFSGRSSFRAAPSA